MSIHSFIKKLNAFFDTGGKVIKSPPIKHTKEDCCYCYVDKCIDDIGEASKNNKGMSRELMDKLADDRFINFLIHSAAKLEEREPK